MSSAAPCPPLLAEHFRHGHFLFDLPSRPLETGISLAARVAELVAEADGQPLSPATCAALESDLERGPLRAVDADFAHQAAELITKTRKERDSIGAALEVVAVNVPPLIGEPLYQA